MKERIDIIQKIDNNSEFLMKLARAAQRKIKQYFFSMEFCTR